MYAISLQQVRTVCWPPEAPALGKDSIVQSIDDVHEWRKRFNPTILNDICRKIERIARLVLSFQSLVVDLEELDIESELGIGGDRPTRGASGAVAELSYVYIKCV